MDDKARQKLDIRIKSFFIEQVRKDCGEDFKLIEGRIEEYLLSHSLKEARFLAKAEINIIKGRSAQ